MLTAAAHRHETVDFVEMQFSSLVAFWTRSVWRVMPEQGTLMPSWRNGWARLDEKRNGGAEQRALSGLSALRNPSGST
jgi:hypothetical protein